MSIDVLSVRGLRPEFGKVDRDLWLWFCEAKKDSENYHGPRVTKRLVQAKAKQAFQEAGILNFKASDGWYIRWLKRWHRSLNDPKRLNNENDSSKKNGDSVHIQKKKTSKRSKSKHEVGSTLKHQAEELYCHNSGRLPGPNDNQLNILSSGCHSNSVTFRSDETVAVSPELLSVGNSDPSVPYVSSHTHMGSDLPRSGFEHSFSFKDGVVLSARNSTHGGNHLHHHTSSPISLDGLSWNDLPDVPYFDRLESLKSSEAHAITNEHSGYASGKQVSKLPIKGKGKLQTAQTFLATSYSVNATPGTAKSNVENKLSSKSSAYVSHSSQLSSMTNPTVTSHMVPKEKDKSFGHETYADFEETACSNFAQHDLEDFSVSSDFVNQLNDEHSLELNLEYGHENLSQQVIKKTLLCSKLNHESNVSHSVQNDFSNLVSAQPSFTKLSLFSDVRSEPDIHVNDTEDEFSSEENDYISEAVLLSMQEDDFSILDCDQSPFHSAISGVDENSQLHSEHIIDEGLQMTCAIQGQANESLEIMFPPSMSHFDSTGQERVHVSGIMGEESLKASYTSLLSSNNMVPENNNIYVRPEEESQEQYFVHFPLLNEECMNSERPHNSFLSSLCDKKYPRLHMKNLARMPSLTHKVLIDTQSSSPSSESLTTQEMFNSSTLNVEEETFCPLTSSNNKISLVDAQDFTQNSSTASIGADSPVIDHDVFLTTCSNEEDLSSFPSTCFLEETSLEDSQSPLVSESCSHISNMGITSMLYVPFKAEEDGPPKNYSSSLMCHSSVSTETVYPSEHLGSSAKHSSINHNDPSSILLSHESLKENEIASGSIQHIECDPGSSVSIEKKNASCLTERSKSNIVVEDNQALYRRSSGDRYFPYFKDKVANYALKHTAKEAARFFGVNVDTVTMWTRGRQETDAAVKNHPDQIMLRWLKRCRESGTILTRDQIFDKATQLLKTPGNWVKDKSRWFHVWATRLADEEKKKRLAPNVQEVSALPIDCGEKKALYPDEFKVEVVLYAEQTSKNHASTIFNIARKRVFEWTAAFKITRNEQTDESSTAVYSDQTSTSFLREESSRISTVAPIPFSDCKDVKVKLNSKGMGRAVTSIAVDHELWLWFCEQTSKKSKPKSKEIRAKAVELFRAHNHDKIQCSHGWLKKWCMRYGIALRHEGDNDLLAWCLEQFDCNRNISHRDLLGYAHESLAGTHKSEFKASAGWLVRFCKRHRHLLSTKPSIGTEIPITLKHCVSDFRLQVQKLINSSMIPLSNVGSIDEVPLNFTAAGGARSRLLLRRSGLENCHAIVILCCLASGELLPPAIIFKGDGPTEQVTYDNISLMLFYQQDCCMTDAIMVQWLECVWNKTVTSPSVLIADCYDPHCSESVKEKCVTSNVSLCIIPAGCSYKLQPLDVAVSRLFETIIYNRWTRYFSANDQLSTSKKNCYSSNSVIAQWVAETLNSLMKTQKEAVCCSFLVTGLTCALNGTEDHFIEDPTCVPFSPLLVSK